MITAVFPPLRPMVGFEQHTPWHRYTVWEHTVRAVSAVAPEPLLRWVMLLHDSGKPDVFFRAEDGVGHAYGHPRRSAEIASELFDRMHFDTQTRERALILIECHDLKTDPDPRKLTRLLNRFGEETLRQLIAVQCADGKAKGTDPEDAYDAWAAGMNAALDSLLASGVCYDLKALAVRGKDLIGVGMRPGPRLGLTLRHLLEAVMDGRVANDREALLRLAREENVGESR